MTERASDEPTIGSLEHAQLSEVAAVLARSFRDNPLNRAVVESADPERRLRSNLHGMHALLPIANAHGEVSVAQIGGRCVGGLVSSPPGRFPLPPPRFAPRLRCLIGQGWRIARRWGEVFEALELLHPIEPHWYLGTLGVEPTDQRQGFGRALLRHWLEKADRDGVPAYLETDRETNLMFYERAGFRVKGEARILAIPVWCMQRPASTAARRY